MPEWLPDGVPPPDLPPERKALLLFLSDIWEQCEVAKPIHDHVVWRTGLQAVQRTCETLAAILLEDR